MTIDWEIGETMYFVMYDRLFKSTVKGIRVTQERDVLLGDGKDFFRASQCAKSPVGFIRQLMEEEDARHEERVKEIRKLCDQETIEEYDT